MLSTDGPVEVRHLLFDLDNTIYPSSSGLAGEMEQRMTGFVAMHLGVSEDTARKLRHEGFRLHGTTLRWLTEEKGLAHPEEFLDYIHPADLGKWLVPQPGLPALLDSLELPKAILTNAPRSHAIRVLEYFGISRYFTAVIDISMNGFQGKPHPEAYRNALTHLGWEAATTVFVDDIPQYLQGFERLGGHCLLVDENDRYKDSHFPRIPSISQISRILVPELQG